ncbi:MAG TPA: DUF6159 family protein [Chitinophagales bacterium]|nr:DUF6159 family protein [Chitinophagales bacterium]HNO29783.1 DUF6159 family protein [Chitinophagales bacterium]HNO29812.1 DUF6159 family protein [Chitinophagales bacterium]
MNTFDRMGNGWKISMAGFSVIRKNKQLLVFPILSGAVMLLIIATFIFAMLGSDFGQVQHLLDNGNPMRYFILFVYYLISYFVVVFFNMALIHCARLYFQGKTPTISDGLNFSMSRIGVIFSWALVAATVGLILRSIQEKVGIVGKIITGLVGLVWSVATFFVVPVLAYENLRPIDAVKRSAQIMREKWGESIGAGFSLLVFNLLGLLLVAVPLFFIGSLISTLASMILAFLGVLIVTTVSSAAQTIFISAAYLKINNEEIEGFDDDTIDGLFYRKD